MLSIEESRNEVELCCNANLWCGMELAAINSACNFVECNWFLRQGQADSSFVFYLFFIFFVELESMNLFYFCMIMGSSKRTGLGLH
jgi:hypothetical protein